LINYIVSVEVKYLGF